jgi:hypothetical protein
MNVKGNIIKANITMPAIEIKPPSPSLSFLTAARYFFPGVRTLSQGDPTVAIACTFLAAQTLECALKAYLSNAGVPIKELKNKKSYCHNLEALWVGAATKGLAVQPQPPDWCVILNQTHDDPYYLRYPIGINGFQYPAFSMMVPELSKLIDLVGSIVR